MSLFSPSVDRLKKKGDVQRLVSLLGHKDAAPADQAEAALISLQAWLSVALLAEALEDDAARQRAASVLCGLNDEILVTAMRIMRPELASKVLGALPADRVVEILIALVKDSNPARRQWAMLQLGELKDRRATEVLLAYIGDDQTFETRFTAVLALEKLGDERAIAPLENAVQGQHPAKHMHELKVLGVLGDSWAVDQLVAILLDPEAFVDSEDLGLGRYQETAARSLSEIGGPRAIEGLMQYMENAWHGPSHLGLCRDVPEALGESGDRRAVEPLLSYLDSAMKFGVGDGPPSVIEALGKLGDGRAIEPLARLLLKQRRLRYIKNRNERYRGVVPSGPSPAEWRTNEALAALKAAAGEPIGQWVPDSEMQCAVCGLDFLNATPATLDLYTGAVFCEQHAQESLAGPRSD